MPGAYGTGMIVSILPYHRLVFEFSHMQKNSPESLLCKYIVTVLCMRQSDLCLVLYNMRCSKKVTPTSPLAAQRARTQRSADTFLLDQEYELPLEFLS